MKKTFLSLFLLCLGVTFPMLTSCDSDDDDTNKSQEELVVAKKIASVTVTGIQRNGSSNSYTNYYEYDDQGHLVKAWDNEGTLIHDAIWNRDQIKTLYVGKPSTLTLSQGKVSKIDYRNTPHFMSYFTYDAQGQMINSRGTASVVNEEGEEVYFNDYRYDYVWKDGKMVKEILRSYDKSGQQINKENVTTYSYYPTKHKYNFPIIAAVARMDYSDFQFLHPDLFGMQSHYLLASVEYEGINKCDYEYSFDKEGYFTRCVIKDTTYLEEQEFDRVRTIVELTWK